MACGKWSDFHLSLSETQTRKEFSMSLGLKRCLTDTSANMLPNFPSLQVLQILTTYQLFWIFSFHEKIWRECSAQMQKPDQKAMGSDVTNVPCLTLIINTSSSGKYVTNLNLNSEMLVGRLASLPGKTPSCRHKGSEPPEHPVSTAPQRDTGSFLRDSGLSFFVVIYLFSFS